MDTVDNFSDALIDAGGVAPVGAPLDYRRDVLTARAYTHPALDGRVVVRLATELLGPAEDLAMGFLGAAHAGSEPVGGVPAAASAGVVPVGVVRRRSLGFPAWALAHDPANARHALALVAEIEHGARLAQTKPGRARAEFEALAERLAGAAPHFLPSFYEQAARVFLAADNRAVASAMFSKAREAERAYSLAVDEDDLAASFLEFALAGAVSAKAMTDYGRQLAVRCEPAEAYERYRRVCVERVAAGLPPHAAMPAELRRMARSAGLDNAGQDAALAGELLALTAVSRAPLGFWTAYRPALVRAAKRDPQVGRLLLGITPTLSGSQNHAADDFWLELLEQCGAFDLLTDPSAVPEPSPGAAGEAAVSALAWLGGFARHASREWHGRQPHENTERQRGAKLHELVDRMGPRLVAEQAAGAGELTLCAWPEADIDLIDQCLALGVRIADPTKEFGIDVPSWLTSGSTRNLTAFAADMRLRPALRQAVELLAVGNVPRSREARPLRGVVQRAVACAGLRGVLRDYLAERAALTVTAGLADLEGQAQFWQRITEPAVLAVNPEAVRRVAELDVAEVLGHALRAGILDEYGWPALENACAKLAGVGPDADPYRKNPGPKSASVTPGLHGTHYRAWNTVSQWPYLVVSLAENVAVVGGKGTVLACDATVPKGVSGNTPNRTLRYVDGRLLVAWWDQSACKAYWSTDPGTVLDCSGQVGKDAVHGSLELLGGGRTFGGEPLAYPDTAWTEEGRVVSDGATYWTLSEAQLDRYRKARLGGGEAPEVPRWYEFDPATGRPVRTGRPAFFQAGKDEGKFLVAAAWLRPAVPGTQSSPLGRAGGLLGSRTRRAQDGTQVCTGIDGRRIVRGRMPGGGRVVGALDVPGAADRLAVLDQDGRLGWHLADGPRRVSALQPGAQAGTYSRGTWCMPPMEFWHFLTVRDEAGSAALRRLPDQAARDLLDRADGLDYDAALVLIQKFIPDIANARLAAGITGYLGVAAACARQLSALGERLAQVSTDSSVVVVDDIRASDGASEDASAAADSRGRPRSEVQPQHSSAAVSPTPDSGPGRDQSTSAEGASASPAAAITPLVKLDDHMGRIFSRARRGLTGGRIYQGLSLPDAVDGLQDLERILVGPAASGTSAATANSGNADTSAAVGAAGAMVGSGAVGAPGAVGGAGATDALGAVDAVGAASIPAIPGAPGAPGAAGAASILTTPGAVGAAGGVGAVGAASIPTIPNAVAASDTSAKPNRPRTRLYQYLTQCHWEELAKAILTAPALAYRALSAVTGQAERAALGAFLSALADSDLAAPQSALRLIRLVPDGPDPAVRPDPPVWTVVESGHGRAVIIGSSSQSGRTWYRALDFSRDGGFVDIPGWRIVRERRAQPWPNAGGLAGYRRAADGRDPVAPDPRAAERLSALTGLSRAEAAVLLAGLPTETAGLGDPIQAGLPGLLGLKATELKLAAATFGALDDRTRARLVAALLPDRVEELWQTGPNVDAAAAHWIALRGRQDPVPEWLLAAAAKATAGKEEMVRAVRGLLNPDEATWLGAQFESADILWSARALVWLCYVLPDGDPLRARLPRALEVLREQLADPDLQTEARWVHLEPVALADLLGYEAVESAGGWRIGPFSVTVRQLDWCSIRLHPADLSGPSDPVLTYLASLGADSGDYPDALRFLLGEEVSALVESGRPAERGQGEQGLENGQGGLGEQGTQGMKGMQDEQGAEPYPAQDPSRSAPHLVAEAAETLAISQDAATLYLMLLALPDPTDRNQARWTGWDPARLAAARAELAGTDLVVAGRRQRAGRGLFLPGGWNELKPPYLPVEVWKAALFGIKPDADPALGLAVPRIPVAELFALVWRRVQAGDGPRYLGLAARAR